MRKKICIMGMILAVLLLTGCGQQQETASESQPQQEATEAAENAAQKSQEAERQPYVVAADDLGNLQLADAQTPVYDKYTLAERRAKGLATAWPEISPWREGKVAYLTFDDGPEDKNTPAILAILQEAGVKATFYVLGRSAEAYPDILKQIFEQGHAIGNHSYDHDYGRLYSSVGSYMAEMEQADEAIYGVLGVRPLITRAPGGRMGHFTQEYLSALMGNGYVEHDWNVSSADTAPGNPVAQDFIDNIEGQATTDSAIILMHCSAGHEETVKALPRIIQVLREKGYSFGVVTPMTPQPY